MPATGRRTCADVEIRVPAEVAYVALLRTAAAGLGARLDFTLDDLEDLRMAVGEAAAMALAVAVGDVTARFWLDGPAIALAVTTPVSHDAAVGGHGFGWQVVATLASEAGLAIDAGLLEINVVIRATPLGASS